MGWDFCRNYYERQYSHQRAERVDTALTKQSLDLARRITYYENAHSP